MKYYSAIKQNENLLCLETWKNVDCTILIEISQTEKDKCCVISLTHGISKTKQINKYNKTETFTDTENKTVARNEAGVGRRKQVRETEMYKLPVAK